MGWLERHLNWAGFFGLLLSLCIGFTVFVIIDSLWPVTENEVANWLASAVLFGSPLVPFRWVINRKAQSETFLLIAWIPLFGWTVPFVLSNRNRAFVTGVQPMRDDCSGRCPGCGRAIEPEWAVCPQCRAFLMQKCRACGRTQRVHWSFCPNCGGSNLMRSQEKESPSQ